MMGEENKQPTLKDAIRGIDRNIKIRASLGRDDSRRRGVNTALLMWVIGWWDEICAMLNGSCCPFCGDVQGPLVQSYFDADEQEIRGYEARCHYCGARGPVEHTREEAISAWKNRLERHGKQP